MTWGGPKFPRADAVTGLPSDRRAGDDDDDERDDDAVMDGPWDM